MTAKLRAVRPPAPDLREAWDSVWHGLGCVPNDASRDAAYDDLAARYDELHRQYHRLSFVERSLQTLTPFSKFSSDPEVLRAAIFFSRSMHYTFGDRLNHGLFESADHAERVLAAAGAPKARVSRVWELICALDRPLTATDPEELLLIDIERGMFGLGSKQYQQCERLVRREYRAHFNDTDWSYFRIALLEEIMAQGVYRTVPVAAAMRDRAQRNISDEVKRLRQGIVRS